mmetsp:Transcript_105/g.155  ORF Transcript_105/g.155 Transcript_105/m.155 type:complete len:310 (+) Transcript_105:101-1030(+)|eukprot:CAMPEP_0201708532 /NCGR_PEP_ID=MMETSP0578-20130828/55919_1 /ASSEMBLY_ACC=CAM_ASM_000663 /TAXON_ID=267565 /ORGANISM="Skeletonema grethea, Strain CCMP 1804" /LENGTH=309 /DNA_ID=CAMNT_0048197395 /DNA_START=51 /DNA_END=980 /DNA_ORIENTATION=+
MMADQEEEGIFIYTGGRVPEHLKEHITHVIIHKSVRSVDAFAFYECPNLLDVRFHGGVRRVGREAFAHCPSLRHLKMPAVRVIEDAAFFDCQQLLDVDFGNKLEIVKFAAFSQCISLKFLKMKTVKEIGVAAFFCCEQLTDAEFGEDLERVGKRAFRRCFNLRRIAVPLKKSVLDCDVFNYCENLVKVDFIGNVHKTVSYLSLQCWRNDIEEQMKWINRFLPSISSSMKTVALQQWIESIVEKIKFYKIEHYKLLKEASTELELAVWKTKLEKEGVQQWDKRQREDCRFVCKSNIVIPSVLSFLMIPDG